MARYLTTDAELGAIADAIREKGGTTDQLTYPLGFEEAIENIPSGGVIETITITANGTYPATTGIDGYAPVVVNVPSEYENGEEVRW